MNPIVNLLNRLFEHKVIVNCDRQPYLTRWFLFRRECLSVMLHRFHRSDEDRALHDHPWSFITIILWRGYREHTQRREKCAWCHGSGVELETHTWECSNCRGTGRSFIPVVKRKWPGMICWRPAEWQHRVELIDGKPTITLVIRFRKRREWGFWESTGWIQWNKWWQNKCE